MHDGSVPHDGHRDIPTVVGNLHVRIVGAGPVAVLWPSMFADSAMWDRIVPALSAERRLVLIDGPSHGWSDALDGRSSMPECVSAAVEILTALDVTDPVDWVGCAWGGHVGLHLAAGRPGRLRTLVTFSTPIQPLSRALRLQVIALKPLVRIIGMRGPVRSGIVDGQLTEASRVDAEVMGVVDAMLDALPRAGLIHAVDSFILDRTDIGDLLPRIDVPVLYVASTDRGECTPEQAAAAAARTPHGSSLAVDGARTLVPLEQPGATSETILGFWAAHPA